MSTENINETTTTAAEPAKKSTATGSCESCNQVGDTTSPTKGSKAKTVKKNIWQKLLAIQTTLKAPKNLFNSYGKYNYRNAESILEAVKPFLLEQECVLLLRDDIEVIGSTVNSQTDEKGVKTVKEMARRYVKATATLIDCVTGEKIETYAYANECEHANMSGDQCTGTASSYARKYCLNALFLLDDTKDSDTDEMKNIEDSASASSTKQPASQNTTWSKPSASSTKPERQATKSTTASPKQTASSQPAAQTTQTQSAKTGNGWTKKAETNNGWTKKAQTSSNG